MRTPSTALSQAWSDWYCWRRGYGWDAGEGTIALRRSPRLRFHCQTANSGCFVAAHGYRRWLSRLAHVNVDVEVDCGHTFLRCLVRTARIPAPAAGSGIF